MADVAEAVKEVQPVVEKEIEKAEKKVVDVASDEESNQKPEDDHKENGDSAKNGSSNGEKTNGVEAESPVAAKRKSGAADATDGAVEGTPEKKAKISAEETEEESNSTNGSTEVAA